MERTPALIGTSSALQRVEEDVSFAARSDAKVLITGESGVGKEVVARLIHARSQRSRGPLVSINCAGIPDSLLASELFGHVRGSFTDAYTDKRGWLEQADHGTIFMDEVGEMSPQMQGLLLRFLENGEIQPVGSDRRRSVVDVRVITATNRRLIESVEAKKFREDLYYRLNVIHIDIPPLRERPDDIPVLLEHFVRQFSASPGASIPVISDEVLVRLKSFSWPGNVRQLRNVAERLVVRVRDGRITVRDLPRELFLTVATTRTTEQQATRAQLLFDRLIAGESFWSVIYEPFNLHDITRADVREVLERALELTDGSYQGLVSVFNLPTTDYKRLLNFLRKLQMNPLSDVRFAPCRVDGRRPARAIAVSE